jgi:hypothetical protein
LARILSIGVDEDLLLTRELVLTQTCASVRSTHPGLATRMLKTESFDLIVLCHTLDPSDVEQICQEIEKNCSTCRILSLASFGGVHKYGRCMHAEIEWHDGPGALVRLARNLLQSVSDTPIRSPESELHLIHQRAVQV